MAIETYLISTITDILNQESTSIYFEYDDKTGKVYRIINISKVLEREIHIKIKNPNWTRTYLITVDKKGEDCSIIDYRMTVPNFLLIKENEQWKVDKTTKITIEDNSKIG